jgi:hypothetical protein
MEHFIVDRAEARGTKNGVELVLTIPTEPSPFVCLLEPDIASAVGSQMVIAAGTAKRLRQNQS